MFFNKLPIVRMKRWLRPKMTEKLLTGLYFCQGYILCTCTKHISWVFVRTVLRVPSDTRYTHMGGGGGALHVVMEIDDVVSHRSQGDKKANFKCFSAPSK